MSKLLFITLVFISFTSSGQEVLKFKLPKIDLEKFKSVTKKNSLSNNDSSSIIDKKNNLLKYFSIKQRKPNSNIDKMSTVIPKLTQSDSLSIFITKDCGDNKMVKIINNKIGK